MAVARALLTAADNQPDLTNAEAFYRLSISTAYYALFHRLTEDVSQLVIGQLEPHCQTAFWRSIGHRAFKGLCKELAEQHQQADQAGLPARQRVLAELMQLCSDLLQFQQSGESANYAPQLDAPRATAEEGLLSSEAALHAWVSLAESAKALFAQSLLWHLELIQRSKPS